MTPAFPTYASRTTLPPRRLRAGKVLTSRARWMALVALFAFALAQGIVHGALAGFRP